MTFDLKSLLIDEAINIISGLSPEAGKEIADGKAAFADGKLTGEEAKQLFKDSLATAKALYPKCAQLCDDLLVNITVDVPNIEKTFNDGKALIEGK